jgi:hypothetical protein
MFGLRVIGFDIESLLLSANLRAHDAEKQAEPYDACETGCDSFTLIHGRASEV